MLRYATLDEQYRRDNLVLMVGFAVAMFCCGAVMTATAVLL